MAPAAATLQGSARRQELRGLKWARIKGFREFVSFCLVVLIWDQAITTNFLISLLSQSHLPHNWALRG
jgi:hypothetical protein